MTVTMADDRDMHRRSPLVFLLAAYVLAVLLIGPNVPTPLYPTYRREFHFSALTVTLIYASYAGSLIPALLLFGPLSDVVGRRRVLLAALALGAGGALLLAFAQGVGWLFAGRVLQGIAIGAGSGAATAALRETEPGDDQTRAAIVSTAAMVGGSAVGPLLAGLLVQYASAPRLLSYFVCLALLTIGAVGLLWWKEPVVRAPWRPQWPRIPVSMRGLFITAGATAFLVWAVTALFLALIPTFMATALDISNAALAGAVVSVMLGSSAVVQLRGRTIPTMRSQTVGLLTIVAGLVALNAAGEIDSVILLLIAAVAAGTGQGLAFLGAARDVNLAAPPARLGEVISSFYVVVYAGVGIPIIGVGVLATSINLFDAVRYFSIAVGAGCLLLAATLQARALRRVPAQHTQDTARP
jgi:MFS family permease